MLRVNQLSGFGGRRASGASGAVPVTWNDADKTSSALTVSLGGKRVTTDGSNSQLGIRGNVGKSSGKWYLEFQIGASLRWVASNGDYSFGLALASFALTGNIQIGNSAGELSLQNSGSNARTNGSNTAQSPDVVTAANLAASDVVMLAVDLTGAKAWFGLNGTWGGTGGSNGVPASGANPCLSGFSVGSVVYPCTYRLLTTNGAYCDIAASAADCLYSLPSGFSYWSA